MTAQDLRAASAKSNDVIAAMTPRVQWQHSHVTADKIYCVYLAQSPEDLAEHARQAGIPADHHPGGHGDRPDHREPVGDGPPPAPRWDTVAPTCRWGRGCGVLGCAWEVIATRRVRRELRVAAYAVCINDGNLLLVRYIERAEPQWTLPGGGVEHGEDPYHAVIREVMEETGYALEVERLLGVHSVHLTYPRGRLGVADHHAVRIVYAGRVAGGTLRHEVGGSTDRAAWVPLDRLDELAEARADQVDIGLGLARLRPPTGHPMP